jgi:hypothetical protein
MVKKCLNCRWLHWVGHNWLTKKGEVSPDARVRCDAMHFDMAYKYYDLNGFPLNAASHRSVKRLTEGCNLFENVGV